MKKKSKSKYIYYILLVIFCLSPWPYDSAFSVNSVNWVSYDKGVTLGKIENKKILLHFYADWCRYCRKMAKETFLDPTIVSYLNENFILIRINTDREPKIAAMYNVVGIPSTLLLKENGEKIGVFPGFIPPDRLLSVLKEIQG